MSSDVPVALRVRTATRRLEIDWADGSSDSLPHALLREACRCAACESARRMGIPLGVRTDVAIESVAPYGPNVLHIGFDDGHARGLYPFAMLQALARAASVAVGCAEAGGRPAASAG
jgi:DUF971 family protein